LNNTADSIPRMRSIRETSEATGMSYHTISRLCKEDKIKHIRTGKKVLINLDMFVQYLNGEQQK